MTEKVNNWEAAKALDVFKEAFLDPVIEREKKAREAMEGYKWTSESQKKRAEEKYKLLEGEMINISHFYSTFKKLIDQHESITDMLSEIYSSWYNDVAYDGIQPAEMMGSQAAILQDIFFRIYDALEPLGLEIRAPQIIKRI